MSLDHPVVILDEAGDLDYTSFLDLKELYNACVYECGWYMMGAEGLEAKINTGIKNKKVGFAEIFDRYAGRYIRLTPAEPIEAEAFKKGLFQSVAKENANEGQNYLTLAKQCFDNKKGLRYLYTIIQSTAQ